MSHSEKYYELTKAQGWICACDNGPGRAKCSRPHVTFPAGPRCTNGAFVLVVEPDGTDAVLCQACIDDRAKTARRRVREAAAARAADLKSRQTNLFDLFTTQES